METTYDPQAVWDYIASTVGTSRYHRLDGTGMLNFTDGCKVVADSCGAYWLMNVISSHQLNPKVHREPFQLWTIEKKGDGCTVTARTDTNGRTLVVQEIPYTDFPDELMPFKLWVESGVVLLPAEH